MSLGADNLLSHVASGSGSLVSASHLPSCLPGTCRVPEGLMSHTAVSWLGSEETSAARATFERCLIWVYMCSLWWLFWINLYLCIAQSVFLCLSLPVLVSLLHSVQREQAS